jgi:TPP-dependent pyruvate/acetoin dehydrogenase alpha subunit
VNFLGGHGIVGAHLPLGTGAAFAIKYQGGDQVVLCFFGDGAVPEGEFHESLNLAALWRLPILFVCENNQYAMGTALDRHQSVVDVARKASSYDIPAVTVDGMDVLAVEAAAQAAAQAVRDGAGPSFIECRTYRFRGHSAFDTELYRDKAEVEQWKQRDPISTFAALLKNQGLLDDAALEEIERDAAAEIAEATAFAEAGTWEPIEDLMRFVYSERRP